MINGWHLEDKPYPTWVLSNSSVEIRRVKGRISSLTAHKTAHYEEGGNLMAVI